MSVCPYCGAVAGDAWSEVDHMEKVHPSVVIERLRAAGEHDKANELEAGPARAVEEFLHELDERIAGRSGTHDEAGRARLATMRPILRPRLLADPVAWGAVIDDVLALLEQADLLAIGGDE